MDDAIEEDNFISCIDFSHGLLVQHLKEFVSLWTHLRVCSVVECEGMEWNHSILLSRNHSIPVFGLDKKLSRNHSIRVFGFGMG